MYTVRVVSTPHCSFKAVSLKQLLVWEQLAEPTTQGQGRREGVSHYSSAACGSAKGHILSMTSPNRERESDRRTETESNLVSSAI